MEDFLRYVAGDEAGTLSDERLDALVARWPWFLAARIVRVWRTGTEDPLSAVGAPGRLPSSLWLRRVDARALREVTAEDRIERFLLQGDHRIVAQPGEVEEEIRTEAELDEEDDVVSEELAEIYVAQGLRTEAADIYRKLSLRNPEKSVYFAELIRKMEEQKL